MNCALFMVKCVLWMSELNSLDLSFPHIGFGFRIRAYFLKSIMVMAYRSTLASYLYFGITGLLSRGVFNWVRYCGSHTSKNRYNPLAMATSVSCADATDLGRETVHG
uniref:Uncharacterized protein n=1 Tax=Physcomitrium patens TaxID=3218 RepID=A0A2K1KPF9_PHYPA|nr:hypothetical protein PHYPA_006566 [Physcomitrium patens]